MGSLRLTLCAAALAALTPVSPAHATGTGTVSVTPSSPAPGTDLSLRVSGCAGRTGTAVSRAFVTDARLTESAPGTGTALTGETRIPTSLPPGTYGVTIACADAEVKGTITVVAPGTRPSTPASPTAPVDAGGGGTVTHLSAMTPSAMAPHATGPGTAHAVTGLLLAGAAATAVVLRSGRRSRGTR